MSDSLLHSPPNTQPSTRSQSRSKRASKEPVTQEHRTEVARDLGKEWARSVDSKNAWEPLILTLDGGGIRGYAELLILQELMLKIVEWEHTLNGRIIDINEILPCHYFDDMWGTSTGGLICIMLARLRMSVPQALDVYRNMGASIFRKTRKSALRGWNFLAERFRAESVDAAVKKINKTYCKAHNHCEANDTLLWPDHSYLGADNEWNICHAVLVTSRRNSDRGNSKQSHFLRSYEFFHPDDPKGPPPPLTPQDLDLTLAEAARATSAAPFYFKAFEKVDTGGQPRVFLDGGVSLNNPAAAARTEMRSRFHKIGTGEPDIEPAVLLSIGTGVKKMSPFAEPRVLRLSKQGDVPFLAAITDRLMKKIDGRRALIHDMAVRYTSSSDIHDELRRHVQCEFVWYRRLNPDHGLERIHLGDWRPGKWEDPVTKKIIDHSGGATLTEMEKTIKEYFARTKLHTKDDLEWALLPSDHLEHLAERLVRHRTERRKLAQRSEDDRLRWHTHQGRFVTNRDNQPWDDNSCDKPLEPGRDRNSKIDTTTSNST